MPAIHQVVGLSKIQIIGQLNQAKHSQYIEFAHWLYIPALSALLSFEKQHCVGVDFL